MRKTAVNLGYKTFALIRNGVMRTSKIYSLTGFLLKRAFLRSLFLKNFLESYFFSGTFPKFFILNQRLHTHFPYPIISLYFS